MQGIKTKMFQLILVVGLGLSLSNYVEACIEVEADAYITGLFYSHPDHVIGSDYPNSYEECWVITAPDDYVLKIHTDDGFHLESGDDCSGDFIKILCGEDGEDGYIDTYCHDVGIDESDPIYSDDVSLRIYFETDSTRTGAGFIIYYEAVLPEDSNGGDCGASDEEEKDKGLSLGAIVGIAVGSVVGLAIILAVILTVISVSKQCHGKKKGQVHAAPNATANQQPAAVERSKITELQVTSGQLVPILEKPPGYSGMGYTNSGYSQQYNQKTAPQQIASFPTPTHKANALPPLGATTDAHGVPEPASYIPPGY